MTKKSCPLGEDCDLTKARIAALEDQLRGSVDECVRVGRLWHGAEAKLAKAEKALDKIEELEAELAKAVESLGRSKYRTATMSQAAIKAINEFMLEKRRADDAEDKLEKLVIGAETVLEEWDRGDEAAFREAIEELRADVEEAKEGMT